MQMMTEGGNSSTGQGKRPLLQIEKLSVGFPTPNGVAQAVNEVNLTVNRGEVLGIVGESGSGKSVSAMSIIGLLPPSAIVQGSVLFDGTETTTMGQKDLSTIRGSKVGTIFQDPLSSLNPLMKLGAQLVEAVKIHHPSRSKQECLDHAADLLDRVGIKNPKERLNVYPHELSGGMRQRVMIAIAIANSPDLIIADEPTTALDVTTQAQVLDTLVEIRESVDAAMILISHDLGLVGDVCDRVAVMYNGRIIEDGSSTQVLTDPQHPYTAGLLRSRPALEERQTIRVAIGGSPPRITDTIVGCSFAPRCERGIGHDICKSESPTLQVMPAGPGSEDDPPRNASCHFAGSDDNLTDPDVQTLHRPVASTEAPTLTVDKLTKIYPLGRGRKAAQLTAVDSATFTIGPGRTLAVVGESGSGKTTAARAILRLIEPTEGDVHLRDTDVRALSNRQLRGFRSRAQIVFQDPTSSLNPRRSVGDLIAEPMIEQGLLQRKDKRKKVAELLELVALYPEHADRYPNELSGGQRQRVSIARALGLEPELLVLDEPVSALDVSVQAQVLKLLTELQERLGVAYLFVSHDLGVVRQLADDIAVMQLGRVVEFGNADQIFKSPRHPYTQLLLASVPGSGGADIARELSVLNSFGNDPKGCRFADRCVQAEASCTTSVPPLDFVADYQQVACFKTDKTEGRLAGMLGSTSGGAA